MITFIIGLVVAYLFWRWVIRNVNRAQANLETAAHLPEMIREARWKAAEEAAAEKEENDFRWKVAEEAAAKGAKHPEPKPVWRSF